MTHSTCCPHTRQIDLQIGAGWPRAVGNFSLHQNTRPSRLTQQPDPPSQAGQSTDMTQYYCCPDDNTIVSLRTIVTWLTLNKAAMVTGVLQILLCTCTLSSLSSPHKGIATCMYKKSKTSHTLTIKSSYIALIVSCPPQPLTTATSNRWNQMHNPAAHTHTLQGSYFLTCPYLDTPSYIIIMYM